MSSAEPPESIRQLATAPHTSDLSSQSHPNELDNRYKTHRPTTAPNPSSHEQARTINAKLLSDFQVASDTISIPSRSSFSTMPPTRAITPNREAEAKASTKPPSAETVNHHFGSFKQKAEHHKTAAKTIPHKSGSHVVPNAQSVPPSKEEDSSDNWPSSKKELSSKKSQSSFVKSSADTTAPVKIKFKIGPHLQATGAGRARADDVSEGSHKTKVKHKRAGSISSKVLTPTTDTPAVGTLVTFRPPNVTGPDYHNSKPTATQTPAQNFWAHAEPYIRDLNEADINAIKEGLKVSCSIIVPQSFTDDSHRKTIHCHISFRRLADHISNNGLLKTAYICRWK